MTHEQAQNAAANAVAEMDGADYDHVRVVNSGTSYAVEVRSRDDHTQWRPIAR